MVAENNTVEKVNSTTVQNSSNMKTYESDKTTLGSRDTIKECYDKICKKNLVSNT